MATNITVLQRKFKGISNLVIRDTTNDKTYNWIRPAGFNLQDGVQVVKQSTKNVAGETVVTNIYTSGRDTMLTVSYQAAYAELYYMMLGYQSETATKTLPIGQLIKVPTTGVISAVASGLFGYQIAVDAVSKAAKTDPTGSYSVELTQDDYADHATWKTTDDKFGVGANGELVFSNNLQGDYVTVSVPASVTGVTQGNTPIGELEITCTLVESNNTVHLLHIPSAIVNPEGKILDPEAETMDIMFQLADPTRCIPYTLMEVTANNLVACVD
jgi:hypothetical protein